MATKKQLCEMLLMQMWANARCLSNETDSSVMVCCGQHLPHKSQVRPGDLNHIQLQKNDPPRMTATWHC